MHGRCRDGLLGLRAEALCPLECLDSVDNWDAKSLRSLAALLQLDGQRVRRGRCLSRLLHGLGFGRGCGLGWDWRWPVTV